jgi:acyl carrier protein
MRAKHQCSGGALERMGASAGENAMMSLDQFSLYLTDALELAVLPMTSDARLSEDLDLDSLQMQELALVMYELGAELIEEMIPSIETVGDIYHHYITRVSAEPRLTAS